MDPDQERSVLETNWFCDSCGKDSDEPIVQCKECEKWFHMLCVGVTEVEVKNIDWYCSKHLQDTHILSTLKNTKIDSSQQKLEPRFHKKFQSQLSMVNNGSTKVKSTGNRSVTASLNMRLEASKNIDAQSQASSSRSSSGNSLTSQLYKRKLKELEEKHAAQLEYITKKYEIMSQHDESMENYSQPPRPTGFRNVNKRTNNSNQVQAWVDGNNLDTMTNHPVINTNNFNINELAKLTAAQVFEKKSVPFKLPTFDGNPKDWPMFINAYETSTHELGISNARNLLRLREFIKGEAFKFVEDNLQFPDSVPEVIKILKRLYGRPDVIIRSIMDKIKSMPQPNLEDMRTFIMFAATVKSLINQMQASGMQDHISNRTLFAEVLSRLPKDIQIDWTRYKRRHYEESNLLALSEFLEYIAEDVSDIINIGPQKKVYKEFRSKNVNVTTEGNSTDNSSKEQDHNPNSKCVICNDSSDHTIISCNKFLELTPNRRWDLVVKNRLCRTCLTQHFSSKCKQNIKCGVNGCDKWHNKLLHKNLTEAQVLQPMAANRGNHRMAQEEQNIANCKASNVSNKTVLLRMLPVTLYSNEQQIEVLAFLDDGSDTSLLQSDVANKLKLQGPSRDLCLNMMGNTKITEYDSMLVDVMISGKKGEKFKLKVNTVNSLNLPPQLLDAPELKKKFDHLKGIPLDSYLLQKPKLLIGIDHFRFFVTLDHRENGLNEPIATKTRLGWVVGGPMSEDAKQHEVHHVRVCDCNSDDVMFNLMQKHFTLEDAGIATQKPVLSKDNERAMDIMESTAKKIGKRYEIGLLWKYDKFKFPNSFNMALRRLECLEKRMKTNVDLASNLQKNIQHYSDEGYITKLDEQISEINGKSWYLPVFTVTNVNKPNKFRMVWDAAAKVDGISLNTALLKGPDMLCSLVNVLYKFRIGRIAIGGDIKEMFHQVNIRKEDTNFQRFLWRDPTNNRLLTYVMNVMTFGAACSPTCAQFIKNKNAKLFENDYPEAAKAIQEQHYVDDYIDSFKNETDAKTITQQVKYIHEQAGFIIRNWVSNSQQVVHCIESNDKFISKDLDIDNKLGMEKILGIWWDTETDKLTYKINYNKIDKDYFICNKRPTKRIILKILMSIYDPLGLLSLYLVELKILLQDIWRTGIDWDDEIKDEQYESWQNWASQINTITNLRIERCYSLKLSDDTKLKQIELHIFCDAGERAFAAVAYLRIQDDKGVNVSLIGSKSKIAPMNPISIPRLELMAAELGARFASGIVEHHPIKFHKKIFWTDSTTVLKWLNGDPRNYRQFVAFRIGMILSKTNAKEWRWIPSSHNVADEATKVVVPKYITSTSRWFAGPEFLKRNATEWPGKIWDDRSPTIEELKGQITTINSNENRTTIAVEVSEYSQWQRLVKVNGWINRFCKNLLSKTGKGDLVHTQGRTLLCYEVLNSENQIYQIVQWSAYEKEILQLQNHQRLNKNSKLISYSPYLDDSGILRVKGRIDALAGVDEYAKRPIILPKHHHVTELIVGFYHNKYLHQNHETVVNEIRQKYAIPQLRVVLRAFRSKCQICKNANAKPQPPEEGALPIARLSPFCRPFTYTGVDFFGPMNIVIGRRQEKRYGVIFTCMTVRAIHIEIANSLSTDSFILTFRNFMARRGCPNEIRCDNGTNFHGSENELKKAIAEINDEKIRHQFLTVKWIFNPPAAPHMGGAWERLVRSIKKNLLKILPSRTPTEELLRSYMCEVEMIINTRPLTYLPLDANDSEAITPNHFLLGSSGGQKPLGKFDDAPSALKKNWKISQLLGHRFWKRWVNEYAPTLVRRTKWFNNVKPIEVGNIVIIVDENLQRNEWPMGKVIEVRKGKDNQVRQAVVKTSKNIYTRPASKIAVLDIQQKQV